MAAHATDLSWKPVDGGALYVDGISYDDVIQGAIADCFVMAGLSAMAHSNPDLITQTVTSKPDGTFDVRLFDVRQNPTTVNVSASLPHTESGRLAYGRGRDPKELWPAVIEKAYAKFMGGYDAISNGGLPYDFFCRVLGNAQYKATTELQDLPGSIALGAKYPMVAITHPVDSGVSYTNTGVYPFHIYTVLGLTQRDGSDFVKLRNPWGQRLMGPAPSGDGTFLLHLTDFKRLVLALTMGSTQR
jgi:hypothetical protein